MLLVLPLQLAAQTTSFDIFKGDQKIGQIKVSRHLQGGMTSYSMTSLSEFQLIWRQVVETTVNAQYKEGRLTGCNSSVRVNDSMKDSSNMEIKAGRLLGYVHPGNEMELELANDWTTSRMYFEQPLHAGSIFVESVLRDCLLQHTGEDRYTLTLPNRSKNHYVYRDGLLQEIHVERTLFDLVFRRV
jgi:hypothetical protein